jgi:polar amino acid transport system permease protein
MANYNWDFGVILIYRTAILNGALMTLELTLLSLTAGTCLGLVLCLGKLSKNNFISHPVAILVEVFTGLPLLVLLIWLFYAAPIFSGIQISAFATAVIAISLNLGGFSAEIFRAGIQAIPKGQSEAALMLGLTKIQTLKRIILPQALKIILPPLSGRYIETVKLTSLASIIAVDELLHVGQNLISVSFRPLEVYTAIALIYLAIILPLTAFLRRLATFL